MSSGNGKHSQVLVHESQAILSVEYQPAIGKSKAFFSSGQIYDVLADHNDMAVYLPRHEISVLFPYLCYWHHINQTFKEYINSNLILVVRVLSVFAIWECLQWIVQRIAAYDSWSFGTLAGNIACYPWFVACVSLGSTVILCATRVA